MEVIVGSRRSGKTNYMIAQLRADPRAIMVVPTEADRQRVLRLAAAEGLEPDRIVASTKVLRGDCCHHLDRQNRVLLDDLDRFLTIALGCQVETATLTDGD